MVCAALQVVVEQLGDQASGAAGRALQPCGGQPGDHQPQQEQARRQVRVRGQQHLRHHHQQGGHRQVWM